MDPTDLIQDKFLQDCTIETFLHLFMAHFELSEDYQVGDRLEFFAETYLVFDFFKSSVSR